MHSSVLSYRETDDPLRSYTKGLSGSLSLTQTIDVLIDWAGLPHSAK